MAVRFQNIWSSTTTERRFQDQSRGRSGPTGSPQSNHYGYPSGHLRRRLCTIPHGHEAQGSQPRLLRVLVAEDQARAWTPVHRGCGYISDGRVQASSSRSPWTQVGQPAPDPDSSGTTLHVEAGQVAARPVCSDGVGAQETSGLVHPARAGQAVGRHVSALPAVVSVFLPDLSVGTASRRRTARSSRGTPSRLR